MKLIILMLVITLCFASPSLRRDLNNENLADKQSVRLLEQNYIPDGGNSAQPAANGDSEPIMLADRVGEEEKEEEEGSGTSETEKAEIGFVPSDEEAIAGPPEVEPEEGGAVEEGEEEEEGSGTSETEKAEIGFVPSEEEAIAGPPEVELEAGEEPEEEEGGEEEENIQEDLPEDHLDEVRGDEEASDVFDFGFDTIIEQGIKKLKIPNDTFTASSISVYSKLTSGRRNLYNFTCEGTNNNGSSVINMTFAVYYEANSQTKKLSSYSYVIKTITYVYDSTSNDAPDSSSNTDAATFNNLSNNVNTSTPVDPSQDLGSDNSTSPDSTAAPADPSQSSGSDNNASPDNTTTPVDSSQNTDSDNSTSPDSTAAPTDPSENPGSDNNASPDETTAPIDPSEDLGSNTNTSPDDTTEQTSNITNPVNESTNDGANSSTPLEESPEESPEVEDVLSFGVDLILQRGFAAGKIPVSEYDITKVINITTKATDSKVLYTCSVELRDENQVVIQTQFNVTLNTLTQTKSLSGWSYQVTSKFSIDESAYAELNATEIQDDAEAMSCLNYAIQDVITDSANYELAAVNSVFTQAIKSTIYYKFDVKLDNGKGKTINLVCTVAYKPTDDSRAVKAYATKTTKVSGK